MSSPGDKKPKVRHVGFVTLLQNDIPLMLDFFVVLVIEHASCYHGKYNLRKHIHLSFHDSNHIITGLNIWVFFLLKGMFS